LTSIASNTSVQRRGAIAFNRPLPRKTKGKATKLTVFHTIWTFALGLFFLGIGLSLASGNFMALVVGGAIFISMTGVSFAKYGDMRQEKLLDAEMQSFDYEKTYLATFLYENGIQISSVNQARLLDGMFVEVEPGSNPMNADMLRLVIKRGNKNLLWYAGGREWDIFKPKN